MRNILLALFASPALAAQPDGVSDTVYDCVWDSSKTHLLEIVVVDDGYDHEIMCGEQQPEDFIVAFNAPIFDDGNHPNIAMASAVDNDYYTIVLSNPDDSIPVGPIIHQIIGNVKGSDLKTGFQQAPASSTEIIPFFRPDPPIPFLHFHYCYLVYK